MTTTREYEPVPYDPLTPQELHRAIVRLFPDSPSQLDDAALALGTTRRTLERWLAGSVACTNPEAIRNALGHIYTTAPRVRQQIWKHLASPLPKKAPRKKH